MIQLEGIGKQYEIPGSRTHARRPVLSDFSLTIHEGEFLSIIGPSGCGKSTLLNILAGLEVPDSGNLTLRGVESIGSPGPDRAVVFQEAGLLPWLTVLGNVEYGLKLQKVGKAERRERAIDALKLVHLFKHRDAYPHQLSGGMRQRGSIARALALRPSVLLMDEPFSALDAQTRELLHDELQQLWMRTGVTVVFITHNLNEAVYLSSRVLVMTAPPGRIKSIINVPFGFPRSKSSPDLAAFAANLHQSIREEVDRVAAQELDEGWTADQPGHKPAEVNMAEGI